MNGEVLILLLRKSVREMSSQISLLLILYPDSPSSERQKWTEEEPPLRTGGMVFHFVLEIAQTKLGSEKLGDGKANGLKVL